MKTQLSPVATAGIIIVALAVIGLILYKTTFGAPPSATKASIGVGGGANVNLTPDQLKKVIQEEDAKKKQ
jgi:hypothetical protein